MADFIARLSSGAVVMGLFMAGGILVAFVAIVLTAAWNAQHPERRGGVK